MKNKYEDRGDVTAIIINSPKHGRLETLISTNKLERAEAFPNIFRAIWNKSSQTYYVAGELPQVNGKSKNISLHRWITNAPDGMLVDHINHDGLINTDENLRILTNSQNQQNRKGAPINSTSGITGVNWHQKHNKWMVRIKIKNERVYLGLFTDINEAERVAIDARSRLMPYSQEALAN